MTINNKCSNNDLFKDSAVMTILNQLIASRIKFVFKGLRMVFESRRQFEAEELE